VKGDSEMKRIIKNTEPATFTSWKASHPGATYKNDLCNINDASALVVKASLKQSLLAEQKFLCCYCECRITDANSHIEHFRPKDPTMFPNLQLEYSNLFASCTKEPTGTIDEHCGHKKGNFFSSDLVSPLEPDCSNHFSYMMDGTISGTDQRGQVTVQKLHLDSALLNGQRKSVIDDFLDVDDELLDEEIATHLDEKGATLGEFFTMVEYLRRSGQL